MPRGPIATSMCLLFALAGCRTAGQIEGRVVDALDGSPVAGATVTLRGTTTSARTSDDGTYRLEEIAPGPQHLGVERDGYLALAETDLTVGEGGTVAAEDLRVVPRPPDTGLYLRKPSAYVEVSAPGRGEIDSVTDPGDRRPRTLTESISRAQTYAVSRKAFPESRFTALPAGTRLVWYFDKPVRRAVLRQLGTEAVDRGMTMFSRPEPTWVLRLGKDIEVPLEQLGEQVTRLTMEAPLGRYGLVLFGESRDEYLYFLRVRHGGEGLSAPDGTYTLASPEFAKAVDLTRAWCAQSGRGKYEAENCTAVAPLLAGTASSCPGSLQLPEPGVATTQGALNLTDCTTNYGVTLTREDDGWFVAGIGITASGGDFAAGE